MSLSLSLPFPPSTNTYYRKWRNRMVISERGRAYKSIVAARLTVDRVKPVEGPVGVWARLWAPDKRRRDIDNFCGKALLDALKGFAFGDDSLVWRLQGEWATDGGKIATLKGGRLELQVEAL